MHKPRGLQSILHRFTKAARSQDIKLANRFRSPPSLRDMGQPVCEEGNTLLQALQAERNRLHRAVCRLKESNAELKAELEKEFDRDYKEAIQDNIPVIAKYTARIASLEEEIDELQRGRQRLSGGEVLVSTSEDAQETGKQKEQHAYEL